MDSCGVGAFSLNYGPQTACGKSPYMPDPCLSRAVPTPRDFPPFSLLYPDQATSVPQGSRPLEYRLSQRLLHSRALLYSALTRSRPPQALLSTRTVASCNSVCESPHSPNASIASSYNAFVVVQDPRMRGEVTSRDQPSEPLTNSHQPSAISHQLNRPDASVRKPESRAARTDG